MAKFKASENTAEQVETKPENTTVATVETAIPAEVKKSNDEFDKKIIGDDKNTAGETVVSEEKKPEKTDTKVADEKDAGKKAEEKGEQQEEIVTVSDELAERAVKAGFSVEKIEKFSTVEDLENAVEVIESHQVKVEPEKKPEVKVEQKAGEEKPYDCGLDPEMYDPGVIGAINKVGDTLLAENKQLKQQLAGITGKFQADEVAETTKWFDNKLAELGEDFEPVFGKGAFNDVRKESAEFKNRAALDTEMTALRAGYAAVGKPLPSKDRIFEMALNNLHKDKLKQAELKPTILKLKTRAGQTISRSTSKTAVTTTADKLRQANATLDDKIQER